MTTRVLIDGVTTMQLPVSDRGLLYGDGLFETILVEDRQPKRLARHLDRLRTGCRRLAIPMPEADTITSECHALAGDVEHGVLKLILTRGSGGRGYRPSPDSSPTLILTLHPLPDWPTEWGRSGIAVRWCTTTLAEQPLLAGLKHLNRLEQVLARAEWNDMEIWQEGLMCGQGGEVIEGTQSNLFMVSDSCLLTPRLDRCGIAGIMRGMCIELAQSLGIPCEETTLTRAAVLGADELFLSNSLIGIWPVRQVAGTAFAAPGPMTRALQARLLAGTD